MTIVAARYRKLTAHVARMPAFWTVCAWVLLDVPSFLWWTGLVPLHTLWKARLPTGPQFTTEHVLLSFWYLLAVGVLAAAYRPLVGWLTQAPPARRIPIIALLAMLASASFPFMSHDLFAYYAEYRMMVVHYANPMVTAITSVPHWRRDSWLVLSGWEKSANPYGPLWFALVRAVGGIAPGFGGFFAAMKVLALASVLAAAAAAGRLKRGSGLKILAHPLVTVEFMANGHNDAVMIALLVAAYLLWTSRRWLLAGAAAGLSTSIKYVSVIAAVMLLASVPTRRHRAISLAVGLGIGALCLAPWWQGWSTLKAPFGADHLFLRSFAFIVQGTLVHVMRLPRGDARQWAVLVAAGAFLAVFGLTWAGFGKRRDPLYLGDALLAAGLILMTWLQLWYAAWALPFYALTSHPRGSRTVSYLAYLEVVRVIGWPDGLPALIQVLQTALIWAGLVWVWQPELSQRIPAVGWSRLRWRRN